MKAYKFSSTNQAIGLLFTPNKIYHIVKATPVRLRPRPHHFTSMSSFAAKTLPQDTDSSESLPVPNGWIVPQHTRSVEQMLKEYTGLKGTLVLSEKNGTRYIFRLARTTTFGTVRARMDGALSISIVARNCMAILQRAKDSKDSRVNYCWILVISKDEDTGPANPRQQKI
ncbi:hypothetical protein BDR06DRAFT_964944 [Suillus hirtellus]|nr:hypothetical protein BDR06DRAFT_964944 [Suillus hirtellus]